MSATRLVSPLDVEVKCSFSVPANSPIGTKIAGTIQAFGADLAGTSTVNVPAREVWHVTDIYAKTKEDADAIFQVTVDGVPQAVQPELSGILLSLLTRWKLAQSLVLPNNATIGANIVLTTLQGVAAKTQVISMRVRRVPM